MQHNEATTPIPASTEGSSAAVVAGVAGALASAAAIASTLLHP